MAQKVKALAAKPDYPNLDPWNPLKKQDAEVFVCKPSTLMR